MNDQPANVPPTVPPIVTPATGGSVNGLAIASLVTGILAFLCGLFFMGIIFGAAAIVLGAIGLKKPGGKGLAIAGIVTGIIGAVSGVVFTLFWVIALLGVTIGAGTVATQLDKVNTAIATQNQTVKDQIAAKKEFSKGETAQFGGFEVKVASVTRNYTPEDSYSQASAGKELIVVKVSVKNTSSENESFSSYNLKINENGVANNSSYLEVTPTFKGGSLSPGTTVEGNIVFEVTKDATDLKVQYETIVYDTEAYQSKTLTYTLAI